MKTNIYTFKQDAGKNLYRKKTHYTITIEQDVLARNSDEADDLFREKGGLDFEKIVSDLALSEGGVETNLVDADYASSGPTEFLGKVVYDEEYDETHIDSLADEHSKEMA